MDGYIGDIGGLNREHVVYVVEVYMQDKLFNQLTYTTCPDLGRQERGTKAQSAIKANNCRVCALGCMF